MYRFAREPAHQYAQTAKYARVTAELTARLTRRLGTVPYDDHFLWPPGRHGAEASIPSFIIVTKVLLLRCAPCGGGVSFGG